MEDGDDHIHMWLEIFLSINFVLLFRRSVVAFPSEFTSYPLCCTIVSFLSHYIIDTLNVYVLQDHVVYVHRNWTYLDSMDIEKDESSYPIQKLMSQLPQSLHGQFHGREIP